MIFLKKIPQKIELLKPVPESSHQTSSFGVSQHIGTLILSQSAFPRIVREMEENIGRRKMFGHKRADLINKNTYISERGATIWPKAILKKVKN